MKTYQITLPDEFAAFVDRMIAEGKFEDVDHLIMAAVAQIMDEIDRDAIADQEWLRKEVQKGIDSANRGELLDGPTVMARLMEKLEAAKAQRP